MSQVATPIWLSLLYQLAEDPHRRRALRAWTKTRMADPTHNVLVRPKALISLASLDRVPWAEDSTANNSNSSIKIKSRRLTKIWIHPTLRWRLARRSSNSWTTMPVMVWCKLSSSHHNLAGTSKPTKPIRHMPLCLITTISRYSDSKIVVRARLALMEWLLKLLRDQEVSNLTSSSKDSRYTVCWMTLRRRPYSTRSNSRISAHRRITRCQLLVRHPLLLLPLKIQ